MVVVRVFALAFGPCRFFLSCQFSLFSEFLFSFSKVLGSIVLFVDLLCCHSVKCFRRPILDATRTSRSLAASSSGGGGAVAAAILCGCRRCCVMLS